MVKSPERADEIVAELASVHRRDLVTLAFLLCGDAWEAEDIVQSVLSRLLTSRAFADAESPLAYAKRAVTNDFLDRRRRLQRFARALVLSRVDPSATSSREEDIAQRDALVRAFGVLRPRQRTCVVLRYYGDWDDQSIAQALGVAPATVRSLVSRALPRLRAALESSEGER
jgi:RNA polymerase sigma factor (sigma-70 family)